MAENTSLTKYKSYVPKEVSNPQHYIDHLARTLRNSLTDQGVSKYSDEKLEDDMIVALQKCESKNLNPLRGEIHFTYRVSNVKTEAGWVKRPSLVTITSIDALRLIADRSGFYGGSDDAIHEYDKEGNLVKSCLLYTSPSPRDS